MNKSQKEEKLERSARHIRRNAEKDEEMGKKCWEKRTKCNKEEEMQIKEEVPVNKKKKKFKKKKCRKRRRDENLRFCRILQLLVDKAWNTQIAETECEWSIFFVVDDAFGDSPKIRHEICSYELVSKLNKNEQLAWNEMCQKLYQSDIFCDRTFLCTTKKPTSYYDRTYA